MANEELKEQIDLQKELANLLAEQSDAEAKADSTRKDRVKILQEAAKFENDNKELTKIQKDLISKANELKNKGNIILAKRYLNTAQAVTKTIQQNKLDEQNRKIQDKKLIQQRILAAQKAKEDKDNITRLGKARDAAASISQSILTPFPSASLILLAISHLVSFSPSKECF